MEMKIRFFRVGNACLFSRRAQVFFETPVWPISSPESTFLLVSTRNTGHFQFMCSHNEGYPASRVSFGLDKSGRGKKTLSAASTFRMDHASKFKCNFGVSHVWPLTTKRKQTVGIFSNNSGKHTTTKESFHSKLKIVHTFKIVISFSWWKIYRFLSY